MKLRVHQVICDGRWVWEVQRRRLFRWRAIAAPVASRGQAIELLWQLRYRGQGYANKLLRN